MTCESGAVDYVAECRRLEKALELMRRDYEYQRRIIEVLVAVGHVSREKVEQARDIVSSLT